MEIRNGILYYINVSSSIISLTYRSLVTSDVKFTRGNETLDDFFVFTIGWLSSLELKKTEEDSSPTK